MMASKNTSSHGGYYMELFLLMDGVNPYHLEEHVGGCGISHP